MLYTDERRYVKSPGHTSPVYTQMSADKKQISTEQSHQATRK